MSFALARKKAGFSQREVAEKLSVSDAAVCMWETGKTSPRAALLPLIAELYHCSIDELLKNNTARRLHTMKPTTKYFDAKYMIACFEKEQGLTLGDHAVELLGAFENTINEAYENGYKAGLEAAHA